MVMVPTLRRWEGALMPETVTLERVKHRPTHAIIDSLQLQESSVVGFLKGELRAGEVAKVWRSQVRTWLWGLGSGTLTADVTFCSDLCVDHRENPCPDTRVSLSLVQTRLQGVG